MGPKLYWLTNSPSGGLAISARPRGGDWLEGEVEGWRKQGVDIVISLLTESENEELDLTREASIVREKGIRFSSFPIEDRGVPSSSAKTDKLVEQLGAEIQQGKNVVIHCRQGIGRSSLISAAVLVVEGKEKISSRPSVTRGVEVPETTEQRNWLYQFRKAQAGTDLARHTR